MKQTNSVQIQPIQPILVDHDPTHSSVTESASADSAATHDAAAAAADYQFQFRPLLEFAWKSIKVNAIPGFILQLLALFIVVLYYSSSAAAGAFESIGRFKSSMGFAFSPLVNFFAGGIIPGLFLYCKEYNQQMKLNSMNSSISIKQYFHIRQPSIQLEILFLSLFWSIKSIEVELFYSLQAKIWGNGPQFSIVFPKILIDQFVYNPLWGVHSVTIPYLWKNENFNFATTWNKMQQRKLWLFQFPATLLSTWSVWLIAVSLIYCMPESLQIPLFSIVLCFWSIVLAFSQSSQASANSSSQMNNSITIQNAAVDEVLHPSSLLADSQSGDLELVILNAQVSTHQAELAMKSKLKLIQSNILESQSNNSHQHSLLITSSNEEMELNDNEDNNTKNFNLLDEEYVN